MTDLLGLMVLLSLLRISSSQQLFLPPTVKSAEPIMMSFTWSFILLLHKGLKHNMTPLFLGGGGVGGLIYNYNSA